MMETKQSNTPGPWKALKGGTPLDPDPERWCVVTCGPITYCIASIENGAPGDTLETEGANAHLLAAAPDLLAVVERMVCAFGGNCTTYEPNCEICQARALLARGRGLGQHQ